MSALEAAYTLALRVAAPALPLLSRGGGKLARGLRGRSGAVERIERWAEQNRDAGRPLVWFHAPSVGEALQARAVMERFRERNPDAQVAFTFFSPSAEPLARRMPADVSEYLPIDLPEPMGRALQALRPDAIAFSKTDVWPNLTAEASRRGVPLALLSATLPESSSRLGAPARALLGPAYRRLARIAAISGDDARRFARFGVPEERLSVMGDAHFDRVLERADRVDRGAPLLRALAPPPDEPVLVAGSTWSADEDRLFPTVARLRAIGSDVLLRLVVAPHEPTDEHLDEAEAALGRAKLPARRLADLGGSWSGREVLLVDRLGVLGELYAIADIAYVGGGWGTAGLHSVLEPAAYGIPVVFGPNHANAREAGELVARGAAYSVRDERELEARLRVLTTDPDERRRAGAAARAYVQEGRGAADAGVAVLEELLARAGAGARAGSSAGESA